MSSRGGSKGARRIALFIVALLMVPIVSGGHSVLAADPALVPAGSVLRVSVPEAIGGKTVVGQLTVDRVSAAGFVTAYGCDDGIPVNSDGTISRSDLNFDGRVSTVASNRLLVQADDNGNICFFTLQAAAIIVDVNAVTFDTGVNSFANRRTDTRDSANQRLAAGEVLRVSVPEAIGGKTVVGELTVDQVASGGFVTAYACNQGLPTDGEGRVSRSDLNFDGRVSPVASNRLIVEADSNGDVCFYTVQPAAMIVDVNGVSDVGITSFANVRIDTRASVRPRLAAGEVLRVSVADAGGGKTVVGQLTVDRALNAGFVTAYPCADGIPTDDHGSISRSDLNFDGHVSPVASNRLIVEADDNGDICFYTLQPAAVIVDINAVSAAGITSFRNERTDTRNPDLAPGSIFTPGVPGPVWPPYTPLPPLAGVAALTGLPVDETVAERAILAVKIDNYGPARPQWGLDQADAVIEEDVEGISRFIALFHSQLPEFVGPVRSARTEDLDLLSALNRPVFAYSGANQGVRAWIASAASSGVLAEFGAQRHACYIRSPDRPGPHNLLLDPTCAIAEAPGAGPARPMWAIDSSWTPPTHAADDTTFGFPMDGVSVDWTWDSAVGLYLRSQDGQPHIAVSGEQISARNVVEVSTTYVPSPVDARSPHAVTVGSGAAIVHRDGVAIPVLWSRATAYEPFSFVDPVDDQPVPLGVGTTFIELERA